MTEAEVLKQLTPVFHDVFDDDSIVLSPEMTANDIEGWDSQTSASASSFGRRSWSRCATSVISHRSSALSWRENKS
jgi:hypothetical protein